MGNNNNNRCSSYNHIHRSNINENHCGDNNNYSRTLQRLILKRTSIKKTCNIKRGGLKWKRLCVSVLICVCGSACCVGVRVGCVCQCKSEKERIKVWLLLAISFWRTRLVDIWQTDKKDKKNWRPIFCLSSFIAGLRRRLWPNYNIFFNCYFFKFFTSCKADRPFYLTEQKRLNSWK